MIMLDTSTKVIFNFKPFSDARESLTHNPVQFIIIANDNLDFLLTTRQNKWVGRESSFHMTRGGGGNEDIETRSLKF